jgi:hypothetical protein
MRIKIGESELEVTGPAEFVERKAKEFIELNKLAPLAHPSTGRIAKTSGPSETIPAPRKALSPAQFFKKAGARTDVDRTLLAGYYLESFKQCDSFTAGEIKETIRDAKNSPPKNANDAVNSNIKKGLMMSAGDKDGRRAFVLTSDGEEAVAEMVQD